jgi:surfactin synthase thioesterase subunit
MDCKHISNTVKQGRPIVFVCHSLGGIVAREVSARLD